MSSTEVLVHVLRKIKPRLRNNFWE